MRPAALETQRLLLRPLTLDDAPAYWPLVSLPDVLRYTGEQPLTSLEEVRQLLLARPLRDYAVHGFGRMACIEKRSGRLVGWSGLKRVDELDEVDIGYRFLPECWGKGYATESSRALMQQGINDHRLQRVVALVEPANAASQRVLKKLGLTFERQIQLDGSSDLLDLYATTISAVAAAVAPAACTAAG